MSRAAGLAILVSTLLVRLLHPAAALAAPTPADTLGFEVPGADGPFAGWKSSAGSGVSADSVVVHGGRWSARLRRDSSRQVFAWIEHTLPVGFAGDTLVLHVWLRLTDVSGGAQVSIRQDGSTGEGVTRLWPDPGLSGTRDWSETTQRIVLEHRTAAITFGVQLSGTGTVNLDDVRLEVDGKPLESAPARPPRWTGPRHEISDSALALVHCDRTGPGQVANLALLARVWGFAKYHHPAVTGGKVPWDAELIRVLPAVIAARTPAAARSVLTQWLERIPLPERCRHCATLPADAAVPPPIAWIHDRRLLGEPLCRQLERTYDHREVLPEQCYVGLQPARVADFGSEEPYAGYAAPPQGLRLLALFRAWNAVEYWFPHRVLVADEWEAALPGFVPRFVAAGTRGDYELAILELATHLHDSHADVFNRSTARPPLGSAVLPVTVRRVEGRFVVAGYTTAHRGPATGLEPGDVLTALDGVPVDSIVARCARYYGGSNDAWIGHKIAQALTRGPSGPCRVAGTRDGRAFERVCLRDSALGWAAQSDPELVHHELPGPAFRFLDPEVAYVAPCAVVSGDSSTAWVTRAAGTRCMIVDLRGYPASMPLPWHMVSERTPVARTLLPDLGNPGAFEWSATPQAIAAVPPRYEGRVVVVVDETTISFAEYMAMMLRAAPGALVVGSTTAGADGNATMIPLPGGERMNMTAGGMFWPDRRPTQRVGIVPDVEAHPTIAGIRSGHDEVLEAAIRAALGRTIPVMRR